MRQDVIRAWAHERNIPVGMRGRLPRAVVDTYLKQKDRTAREPLPVEQEAQPTPINTYEPLADYLEPRFGNIYDWENSIVPWVAEGDFDVQPWTDDVREAITEYLL